MVVAKMKIIQGLIHMLTIINKRDRKLCYSIHKAEKRKKEKYSETELRSKNISLYYTRCHLYLLLKSNLEPISTSGWFCASQVTKGVSSRNVV
jgi:hypothetical protein